MRKYAIAFGHGAGMLFMVSAGKFTSSPARAATFSEWGRASVIAASTACGARVVLLHGPDAHGAISVSEEESGIFQVINYDPYVSQLLFLGSLNSHAINWLSDHSKAQVFKCRWQAEEVAECVGGVVCQSTAGSSEEMPITFHFGGGQVDRESVFKQPIVTADFVPPQGWTAHPDAPGYYYYMGKMVLSEDELRNWKDPSKPAKMTMDDIRAYFYDFCFKAAGDVHDGAARRWLKVEGPKLLDKINEGRA